MNINGQHYGIAFLFGGTLMAFISYLSNHVSTRWAAILSSINLSIFVPLFIHRSRNVVNFVWNEIWLASFISIMSLVFYGVYLYTSHKIFSLLASQLAFITLVYYAYDFILV
jgi:hypothetical protein